MTADLSGLIGQILTNPELMKTVAELGKTLPHGGTEAAPDGEAEAFSPEIGEEKSTRVGSSRRNVGETYLRSVKPFLSPARAGVIDSFCLLRKLLG